MASLTSQRRGFLPTVNDHTLAIHLAWIKIQTLARFNPIVLLHASKPLPNQTYSPTNPSVSTFLFRAHAPHQQVGESHRRGNRLYHFCKHVFQGNTTTKRLIRLVVSLALLCLTSCTSPTPNEQHPTDASGETEKEAISEATSQPSLFRRDNLVAWAVVPFDAKNRMPSQRAAMLQRLGFSKFAYDWRENHVPHFEDEIKALKNAGIGYFAFWNTHDSIFKLFTRYQLSPQIWWYSQSPSGTQQQRVEQAAKDLVPIVQVAAEIGSTVGLYNHLDWGGEPENMVAVVRRVHEFHNLSNIGIVYNFHHGHAHIQNFASALALMKPYLLCVNLNGMNDNAEPKILTLGKGKHERTMLQLLRESGFRGNIGIIAHQETRDAEVVLRENLEGLQQILREQKDWDALQSFEP